MITDSTTALDMLKAWVQWDQAPALTESEIGLLLQRHMIIQDYEQSRQYFPWQRVAPGNGYVYEAVQNGVGDTADELPDIESWPIPRGWPSDLSAEEMVDGTVTWRYYGPEPLAQWDLRAAASEACDMKAGKAAAGGTVQAGNLKVSGNETADYWRKMARKFAPIGVA